MIDGSPDLERTSEIRISLHKCWCFAVIEAYLPFRHFFQGHLLLLLPKNGNLDLKNKDGICVKRAALPLSQGVRFEQISIMVLFFFNNKPNFFLLLLLSKRQFLPWIGSISYH